MDHSGILSQCFKFFFGKYRKLLASKQLQLPQPVAANQNRAVRTLSRGRCAEAKFYGCVPCSLRIVDSTAVWVVAGGGQPRPVQGSRDDSKKFCLKHTYIVYTQENQCFEDFFGWHMFQLLSRWWFQMFFF